MAVKILIVTNILKCFISYFDFEFGFSYALDNYQLHIVCVCVGGLILFLDCCYHHLIYANVNEECFKILFSGHLN